MAYIKDYLELRAIEEFKGDFSQIKDNIYIFLDNLCMQNFKNFDSYDVFYFTIMLEDEELFWKFKGFLKCLPEYVNKNTQKYSFDEQCYFCLIANMNKHIVESENNSISFFSNLSLLQQHIKTASFSRGFKIDVHSNFYKLLQTVNMAEFFGDSTY